MDKFDLKTFKELAKIANRKFVTPADLQGMFVILIAGVQALKKDTDGDISKNDKAINEKLDAYITLIEKQFQQINKAAESNVSATQKALKKVVEDLTAKIEEIELIPGDDGNDAELTDDDKEEMKEAVIAYIEKTYSPKFAKSIEDAIGEAVKNIKPNTVVIQDSGAPFEIPLKSGVGINVKKNAAGEYVISYTGSATTTQVDNEIVAGSNTSFSLAHTPVVGTEQIYGGGSRLTAGIDYTISGAAITMTNGYSAGQVVADYQF